MFALGLLESTQPGIGFLKCLFQLCEGRPEDQTRRQDHRAFYEVLQFAHIAGPRISRKDLHCLGRNRFDPPIHALCAFIDIMPHEDRDVFAPFAQRRDRER